MTFAFSNRLLMTGLTVAALAATTGMAQAASLSLGGNYVKINATFNNIDQVLGGGSISPSTLDGNALPFVYCVDIPHHIGVPGDYDTTVTTDGKAFGSPINNADKVAYLVKHYGLSATTTDEQGGLQAAIWSEIYGSNFTLDSTNTAGTIAAYNADLAGVGSGNVADLLWLSPGTLNDNGDHLQALITLNPNGDPIPEPAFYQMGVLLAGGGLMALRLRRRTK